MIYIVIGQSGSGKTTFVKQRWLAGDSQIVEGHVPYTLCEGRALIGKYDVGLRTEGTDTLPYNALPRILKQIDHLYPHMDIVLEGDRINNRRLFEHILRRGYAAKLYLLRCPLTTSMKRLRAAGSKITPTFVKATRTKSERNFLRYAAAMNGEVVVTG